MQQLFLEVLILDLREVDYLLLVQMQVVEVED